MTGRLLVLAAVLPAMAMAATLISREEDEEDVEAVARYRPRPPSGLRAALVVAGTFALAELGDKSMLATLTLATQGQPLGVWAGATLALVGVSLIAVVVGRQIGTRLPYRIVRLFAAGAFALFGVLLLVDALLV
jgi:putative Ca2+/H+ antiporter (TMEM165/GDT1 family)